MKKDEYYDNGIDNQKNNILQVTETSNGKKVDFYLIDVIEDIKDYIDFLREVETCRNGDTIMVHINCYGGNMDVALNIYDVLICSTADVQISIEGACCSAASMIMLTGRSWRVLPHSHVMIHCWTEDIYGKWHEINAKFNFDKEIEENRFRDMYAKFLTDEEIEECINGKDFYFDNFETMKRLEIYQKEDIEREIMLEKISKKYSNLAQKEVDGYFKSKIKTKKKNGGKSK